VPALKYKTNLFQKKESTFLILLIITLSCSFFSYQDANAIAPVWSFSSYNTNDGAVQGGGFPTVPVEVTVTDYAATGFGSITVVITSSVTSNNANLTLNEGPPGVFKNINLALMREKAEPTMSDDLIITVWDDINPLPTVQIISNINVFSDTDTLGLFITLTETGPETNLYQEKIEFGTFTNPSGNILAAAPGDIFTVADIIGGNSASGIILPNPNTGKAAIEVEEGGTITATYQGDSSVASIGFLPSPGRGSGGLVAPGLVVDSSTSSGCSGDCEPPTLGLSKNLKRIVGGGFSYNQNPVDVDLYYTPYPLITVSVGQLNEASLKIFDDGGPENIKHVGLAFGLNSGQSFSKSKATINLDRTNDGKETTSVYDPENVFDNVQISTSNVPCSQTISAQCLEVKIQHLFRESLNFNMVGTVVTDFQRNSWQNFYNHGIEIEGESLNPPKTKMVAFGEKKMRGLYELTQVDKKKELWVDKYGNIYQNKGNDRFDEIFSVPEQIEYDKIKQNGCDRQCNWFGAYKLHQELLAEITLEEMLAGKIIPGEPPEEPFSYTYHMISRAENIELQKSILVEQKRAEKLFEELIDYKIHS